MGGPFKITVSVDGARLRLAVDGDLDTSTSSELLDTIMSAVRCDVAGIDLDLSGVTFVDSAGLDVLVLGERAARSWDSAFGYHCHLRILRPSRAAEVALWAAGLDGYLDITESSAGQPAA
jgi:anti-anti-sigma factor